MRLIPQPLEVETLKGGRKGLKRSLEVVDTFLELKGALREGIKEEKVSKRCPPQTFLDGSLRA